MGDAADTEVQRVNAAKNELESFVYESREKVNGDNEFNMQVSTEEERSKVTELSMSLEEWLYEDEAMHANASLLEEKLRSLQDLVYPILRRAHELEQRPQLPEVVGQVQDYVNSTLAYVEKNMTWVAASELEGVRNLSAAFDVWYANVTEQQDARALTEEPAYSVLHAKKMLHKLQTEAQRLTKIKKIDPMPYSSDYGKYGGGKWDDPNMRGYYDAFMKNFSRNGSWFGANGANGSNFSGFNFNDTDYMRSFYENMARNFNGSANGTETDSQNDDGDTTTTTTAAAEHEEL